MLYWFMCFSLFFGKFPGRAISLSQCSFCRKVCSDGMSCSLWTSKTSRFAHQEPARLLQFPRVFYEIHPETGKMRWERSQWKACGDFVQILIRPRIASCKVKALEQCRLELLLYSLHNLQKQNSYQNSLRGSKTFTFFAKVGLLGKDNWYPKLSKCVFVCRHVCFCGCIKWVKVADQF